jgi:acyl-CoA thioesterase-1
MERKRRITARLLVLGALALGLAGSPGHAALAAPPACAMPEDLLRPEEPLPHARAALQPGERLDILALGSGSLLGPHGGLEGSLPDLMAKALRAAVPGASVNVTMRAEQAETASDMLVALKRELAEHHYQLVLWQTGTVEALRRKPTPEQFRQTLITGAQAATAAGADLVLIDLPYSRILQQRAELAPYQDAIAAVAALPDVLRFPRYALMNAWAESGQLDLENTPKPERRRAGEKLRDCLGRALAQMVAAATRGP